MRNEFTKPKVVLGTKPLIKLFAKEEGWEIDVKVSTSELKKRAEEKAKVDALERAARTPFTS